MGKKYCVIRQIFDNPFLAEISDLKIVGSQKVVFRLERKTKTLNS